MQKLVLLSLFLLIGGLLNSQIIDRFDRDELTGGAIDWQGDVDNFIINPLGELQLNDVQAGESTVYFEYELEDSLQWDVYFRMEFNPSNANRVQLYLTSTGTDLTEDDAYFLEIGENGNDVPIYLKKRTGGNEETLLTMELGAMAFDPAEARVRITYQADGSWELMADYEGDSLFADRAILEGETIDWTAGFFGFRCSYTATRATLFFFDDLRIGPIVPDTTGPGLVSVRALQPNGIQLSFDKLLDSTTASDPATYSIMGVGEVVDALFDPGQPSRVELYFEEDFENGEDYEIQISGLKDLSGNSTEQVETFRFILPELAMPGDLVINEIHSLPSNTTLVPDVKYVEIFNPSDKYLDLDGLQFSDRTRTAVFEEGIIEPGEFILLSNRDDAPLLEQYGRVIGMSNFPSINNTSDDLRLESVTGELLFGVGYRTAWFDDPLKADGGYSLELVNPFINCQTRDNWKLSNSPDGGSPGRANSVLDENFSPGIPQLKYATFSDDEKLRLVFNRELDRNILNDPPDFSIDPAPEGARFTFDGENPRRLGFEFDDALEDDVLYTIEIQNATSCGGDVNTEVDNYSFKKPVLPLQQELIINEILFLPPIGVRDFIELKNTTESSYFRLSDLLFYHRRSSDAESTIRPDSDRIIRPEDYLTIGRETNLLKDHYHIENPFFLHNLELMALDNNSGSVVMSAFHPDELVYLDSIAYSDDLHDPLLRNRRGISLERTNPGLSTNSPAAWYSAATLAGGATPTAPNSQQLREVVEEPDDLFFLPGRTFSPNGDGFEDFLEISYQIDQPGYVASIRIFNMKGHLVRDLVRNKSLGTEGKIIWGGENNRGELAQVGIYIILVELHNADGDRKEERLTAVLAEPLN